MTHAMTYKPIIPIDPYPAIYDGRIASVPCLVTGRTQQGHLRIKIRREHKGPYGQRYVYDVSKYVHPGSVYRLTS